jgi:hypothetical protein
MSFEFRLKRLEWKVRPLKAIPEHKIDFDLIITHLGLVPADVKELARSKESSLIEAMCEMLGIEVSEFKDELREATNLVR